MAIDRAERTGGTLAIDVAIANLTGHKFPTGYPSRRAWLHVTVRDAAGAMVFESGRVAETGLVEGNDSDASAGTFEPHYAELTRADQVQVYESVMGNRRRHADDRPAGRDAILEGQPAAARGIRQGHGLGRHQKRGRGRARSRFHGQAATASAIACRFKARDR